MIIPSVLLGDVEVPLPPPVHDDVATRLVEALSLLRQRVVSEEDAAQALEAFESLLAPGPACYLAAHLCVAEVFLSGSAPQHGRDPLRALASILDFLHADAEASVGAGASPSSASRFERDRDEEAKLRCREAAAYAVAAVTDGMDASDLVPHATQLLRLAADARPDSGFERGRRGDVVLRVAALRAHLAAEHSGAATIGEGPRPLDLLHSLLSDAAQTESDRFTLRSELAAVQDERNCLEDALGDAQSRGERLELTTRHVTAHLEQTESVVHGLQAELQREVQNRAIAEKQLREAAANAQNELGLECQRLQQELHDRIQLCHELELHNQTLGEVLQAHQHEMQEQQHVIQRQQHVQELLQLRQLLHEERQDQQHQQQQQQLEEQEREPQPHQPQPRQRTSRPPSLMHRPPLSENRQDLPQHHQQQQRPPPSWASTEEEALPRGWTRKVYAGDWNVTVDSQPSQRRVHSHSSTRQPSFDEYERFAGEEVCQQPQVLPFEAGGRLSASPARYLPQRNLELWETP